MELNLMIGAVFFNLGLTITAMMHIPTRIISAKANLSNSTPTFNEVKLAIVRCRTKTVTRATNAKVMSQRNSW